MTITKSGELASFYTVNKAPIKHLRVYFSPKQAGEGDPSPENVREISGWTGVEVDCAGKNIIPDDLDFVDGKFKPTDGVISGSVYMCCYFRVPKGQLYWSCDVIGQTYICLMDEPIRSGVTTYNTVTTSNRRNYTLDNSDGHPYMAMFGFGDGNTPLQTVFKQRGTRVCLLNYSDTISPSKRTVSSIDWLDSAGTVYGGYVDLVTGELVKTHNLIHYDGTENWEIKTSTNNPINSPYTARIYVSDGFRDGVHYSTVYSNKLKPEKNYYTQLYGVSLSYTSVFNIGTPSQVSDISSFKTWMNDIQGIDIIYPLQNPITHQLTPTQLQTLIGQNNIWSNADRVEIEYDLAESNDELYRRRNIILNTPHIETVAGSIANFKTDIQAPLKECKIHFAPVQEGEGDPSPNNVRVINGWTGLEVYKTGKNLANVPNPYTFTRFEELPINLLPPENYMISGITTSTDTDEEVSTIRLKGITARTYAASFLRGVLQSGLADVNYKPEIERIEAIQMYAAGGLVTAAGDECTWRNVQVELGKVATTYEPYTGTTIPITFPSEAETVYGGYVDLVAGEVWQTWGIAASSVIAYRMSRGTATLFQSGKAMRCYCPEDCMINNNWTVLCTHFTDAGPVGNWSMDATNKDGYVVEAQGRDIMFIASDLGFTTNQEWVQWVIDNNMQYVYPLQTPKLIGTITPTQLKTLRGTNNIWSNAGDITLSYWKH